MDNGGGSSKYKNRDYMTFNDNDVRYVIGLEGSDDAIFEGDCKGCLNTLIVMSREIRNSAFVRSSLSDGPAGMNAELFLNETIESSLRAEAVRYGFDEDHYLSLRRKLSGIRSKQ
jgi:hypothetical protein